MFAEGTALGLASTGIPLFLAYLVVASAMLALFLGLYLGFTRHDELGLIRQGNISAALALAGAMIGFCIPLAKALAQAGSITDLAIWGGMALIIQLLAYGLAHIAVPGLSIKIEENAIAPAVVVAALSLAFGMLSAAAMTE